MQKKFIQISIFIFSLLVFSLVAQAQIQINETTGCIPKEFKFTYNKTGLTDIYWDFNDGGSYSTNISATHTFNKEGEYTITFKALDGTTSIYESVKIKLYKGFQKLGFSTTTPIEGCLPLSVNFTDTSQGSGGSTIKKRKWDFGDGVLDSSGVSTPSHAFTMTGNYNVKLTVVDNNGCIGEKEQLNYVHVSSTPIINYTTDPSPPNACTVPISMSFNASNSNSSIPAPFNSLSYKWIFNKTDSSNLANASITYTNKGDYSVKLIVTDAYSCSNTKIIPVRIDKPLASFTVKDSVCKNVSFKNNSLSSLTSEWDFGDNSAPYTSSDTIISHTYTTAGKYYDVTLRVTDSKNCSADSTYKIWVDPIISDFDIDPIYYCQLPVDIKFTNKSTNAIKWIWEMDTLPGQAKKDTVNKNSTVTLVNDDTSKYTINDLRTYRVTLYVTSKIGCKDSLKKYYEIFLPTALFKIDKMQGCAPLSIIFTDTSKSVETITARKWIFGDGDSTMGNLLTHSHSYKKSGKYYAYLIITNSLGCIDTSYKVLIQVGDTLPPKITLSSTLVCPYETVETSITNATKAIDGWNLITNGELLPSCDNDSIKNNIFNYTTGPQDLTYTVRDNGCFTNKIFKNAVTVKGPIARFDHSFLCEKPYDYTFTCNIMEANKWVLDFGDNSDSTTLMTNPFTDTVIIKHTYKARGDYKVLLTAYNDASGCLPFKDSIIVKVKEIKAAFKYDSLVCLSILDTVNASASQDVYSTDHQGYEWYWGDNAHPLRTDKANYSHKYDKQGKITTTLIVKDINGCTDTVTHDLFVHEIKAGFTTNKKYGCIPLTVAFKDTSIADTTIVDWKWTFGDNTSDIITNPNHTYTTPIYLAKKYYPYTIRLTVTDTLGCISTTSVNIMPSVPDASFKATTDTSICEGTSISYLPNIIDPKTTYKWDFGDSDTLFSKTNNTYNHIFKANGNYDVTLTISDSIKCPKTYTLPLNAKVLKTPQAGFKTDVDNKTNLCHPQTVLFMDTSIIDAFDKRHWDLGDGNPKQPLDTIGIEYQKRGTYTIQLIEYSTYGCSDTAYRILTVVGPEATFTMDRSNICLGESITFNIKDSVDVATFNWDFGDGTDSNSVAPIQHTYNIIPVGGQTKVSLTTWSAASGCFYTVDDYITVNYVKADFKINDGVDTANCVLEPVIFTDKSTNAYAWNWDFGNNTNSNSKNDTITYSIKGDYTINLIATNLIASCKDTIEKKVTIYQLPTIKAFGGDTCEGKALQLKATGGTKYTWQPVESLSNATIANPFASPIINTTYTVTVADSNNCANTASTTIVIQNHPGKKIGDETIVIGENIQLDADEGSVFKYAWTPDTALSCIDCPITIANPKKDITYYALVKDTMGCFTDTSIYKIIVLPYSSIDVPDVFSPNADGINDIVYVKGWGIKHIISFRIYNRWGEKVFETNDINQGWDGYFQNKLQNSDTYVYVVDYESFVEIETKTMKGYLSLIR